MRFDTPDGAINIPDVWLENQPEPSSDCASELEHYVMLWETGQCPWCGQESTP